MRARVGGVNSGVRRQVVRGRGGWRYRWREGERVNEAGAGAAHVGGVTSGVRA